MQHVLTLPTFKIPDFQTLWKEHLSVPPLWMIASVGSLLITGTMVSAAGAEKIGICHSSDMTLSYAWYNKRGDIVDRTYRCGKPHATCKIRNLSAARPIYDCSPFVLPKGTIVWK